MWCPACVHRGLESLGGGPLALVWSHRDWSCPLRTADGEGPSILSDKEPQTCPLPGSFWGDVPPAEPTGQCWYLSVTLRLKTRSEKRSSNLKIGFSTQILALLSDDSRQKKYQPLNTGAAVSWVKQQHPILRTSTWKKSSVRNPGKQRALPKPRSCFIKCLNKVSLP